MSSTDTSSSNFRTIFNAALSDYTKQTHIDLTTYPFARTLQNCDSVDAILDLFLEKAQQFRAYREGDSKLINFLKSVVQVLHAVSSVFGEAASLVNMLNYAMLSHRILMVLFSDAIRAYKSNSRWD